MKRIKLPPAGKVLSSRINPPSFLASVLFLFLSLAIPPRLFAQQTEGAALPPHSTTLPHYDEIRAAALKDPMVCWLLAAATKTDSSYRGSAIGKIARRYWKEGEKEKAEKILQLFSNGGAAYWFALESAEEHFKKKEIKEGLTDLETAYKKRDPSDSLLQIAKVYLRYGVAKEGKKILLETIKEVKHPPADQWQIHDVAFLSAALKQSGDEERAESLMKEVQTGLANFKPRDPVERIALEAEVSGYAGEYEQAVQTISKMKDTKKRLEQLYSLSWDAIALGRLEEARFLLTKNEEVYQEMKPEEKKSLSYPNLAPYLEIGDFDAALNLMKWIDTPQQKVEGLINVAEERVARGERKQPEVHLLDALRLVSEINNPGIKAQALGNIGSLLAKIGAREKADEVIKESVAEFKRSGISTFFTEGAFATITEALIRTQKYEEALILAHDILHHAVPIPGTPNSTLRLLSDILGAVANVSYRSSEKFPLEKQILKEAVAKMETHPDFFTINIPQAIENVYAVLQ
ncbi:MAG: hypothetical protein MPW14_13905 [Candidatus Manganitrophus sp.]|nr:hypothetical protein [Candidatus Manganitrophus sp.]MDC4223644.1 hypothetical protein [Candidatus Manganitrophus sp.]WDT70041.1 MAG: hypothetical protein MPW17_14880 [Candidatus Manganitrophus sp.]WDT78306.1 MAG: hypothetical protein MPW14_13905 [Candidatus Manganitrophus sp.]